MPNLLDSFQVRGLVLRNRLVVSPMCMYSSVNGYSNDWHLVHLGSRAVGGFGLVIAEATAVDPRGRISPDDAGLWEEGHIEPLKRVTRFLREYGASSGVQLAHAGRKASTARPFGHPAAGKPLSEAEGGWKVVGPSAIAFAEKYPVPHELTVLEVKELVKAFVAAAKRALEAGFDVIELHGAHGYLIHEFLSPLANRRQDEYGGNLENRARFLMEIVRGVRAVWPESKPLFVRLSCTDWAEGGWTLEDSIVVAGWLKEAGVDLIDCSSGGMVPPPLASVPVAPNYQVPFAEAIRTRAGIATGAVGLITDAKQADAVIRDEKADVVLLARQSLRDPYFPVHAAQELEAAGTQLPLQYARA